MRGLLYPWFLATTWGQDGLVTYLAQNGLFLGSLYAALRVVAFGSRFGLLAILAAMIPAVTFLQKQIYPDGLLLSLTLLFFAALARKYWRTSIGIGILLALTKLVFIIVLPIALVAYVVHRKLVHSKVLIRSAPAVLLLLPVVPLLINYMFVDLGYMLIFERPYSSGYPLRNIFPGPELTVQCAGSQHSIPRTDLFWDPITGPYAYATYGPLTHEQAARFGCTELDLRQMKRRLMAEEFLANPLLHVRLGLRALLQSLIGSYDRGHISGILQMRQQSWVNHFDQRSYFEEYEIKLLEEHKRRGFVITQTQPLIFTLNALSVRWGEKVIRSAALGMLGFWLVVAYRRGVLLTVLQDHVIISLFLFLTLYSFSLAASIPVLYDRYTFVNLMLLCLLDSRLAAIVMDVTRKTQLHTPESVTQALEPVTPTQAVASSAAGASQRLSIASSAEQDLVPSDQKTSLRSGKRKKRRR